MPFCSNCGQCLTDEAKFCSKCGTAVDQKSAINPERRKITYAGEVRKCPACGMELPSIVAICPGCGYEIRSQQVHPVIAKFSDELNRCDQEIAQENLAVLSKGDIAKSGWGSWNSWGKVGWIILNIYTLCIPLVIYRIGRVRKNRPQMPAAAKKSSIIENFQIPNEKEAIWESINLIQTKVESLAVQRVDEDTLYWASLWKIKAKYVYEKAQILLPGDKIISDIYTDIVAKSDRIQKSVYLKKVGPVAVIPILVILYFILALFVGSSKTSEIKSDDISVITPSIGAREEVDILPGKEIKDGFYESTNNEFFAGDIAFSIPSYYSKERQEESTTYLYVESDNSTVMLTLQCIDVGKAFSTTTEEFDSFSKGFLDELGDVDLLDSKDISIAGCPGRTIIFSTTLIEGDTKHPIWGATSFIFNESKNEVDLIGLLQASTAQYNYFSDYEKIIASAACIND